MASNYLRIAMFENNVVAINVHNQITEIDELTTKLHKSKQSFYKLVSGSGTIMLIPYFFQSFRQLINQFSSIYAFISAITIILGAFSIMMIKRENIDPFPWLLSRNKYKAQSQIKKAELFDYLSKQHVQTELLKLFKYNFSEERLNEVKKCFVLAQYSKADRLISQMIQRVRDMEEAKIEEINNQKIADNYDKSLQKESKKKFTIV